MKTPRDKFRGPITLRHNLPGATYAAEDLLTFYDDTDTAVGDIDSQGNIVFYPDGQTHFNLGHEGHLALNVKTAALTGNEAVSVLFDNVGIAHFLVRKPGVGSAVFVSASVTGDVALRLGPFDENNDALDIIGGPDYNGGEYRVWGDGKFSTKAHTAPADGKLVAGECAFWFDQTNGAAKFKIKAKQADGTVRTGEVALA